MGKSAKKSTSEVAAAAVVAPAPTKPLKQGKRGTEEVVEKKTVSAKKQKVGGKKSQIKAKEVPKKKAPSSEDDSEEEIKEPAKNGKVASDSDALAEDESSDEEAAPEKKAAVNGSESEDDSTPDEETSDEENSEEDGTDEEMTEAPAANKTMKAPDTPSTPKEKSGGSKTLFVGNLSFSVDQAAIENFFKPAGEVVDVRLATGADNKFRGFGHVEFATPEQAVKALEELNGHDLLGREVRLDLARERQSGGDRSGGGGGRSGDSGRGRGRGRGRFGDSGRGRGRGRSGDSGRRGGGRGRR